MASMRDVCITALKKISIVEANGTPDAHDIAAALDEANAILSQLRAQDIHTGFESLTYDEAFPLDEKHRLGFTAYLAKHIAPYFGLEASPEIQRQASVGWQLISADYNAPEPLRVDLALQFMPLQRRLR